MTPKYIIRPDGLASVRPYTTDELKQLLYDTSTSEDRGYETPCLIWNGYLDRKGYGSITVRGKVTKVHQVSWELFVATRLAGECVLHHCDQPRCWRPDHLFLGTKRINNHDRHLKGRTAKGENAGLAKLTDEIVLEIRRRYPKETLVALGRVFNVTPANVGYIVRGRTWKHLL